VSHIFVDHDAFGSETIHDQGLNPSIAHGLAHFGAHHPFCASPAPEKPKVCCKYKKEKESLGCSSIVTGALTPILRQPCTRKPKSVLIQRRKGNLRRQAETQQCSLKVMYCILDNSIETTLYRQYRFFCRVGDHTVGGSSFIYCSMTHTSKRSRARQCYMTKCSV